MQYSFLLLTIVFWLILLINMMDAARITPIDGSQLPPNHSSNNMNGARVHSLKRKSKRRELRWASQNDNIRLRADETISTNAFNKRRVNSAYDEAVIGLDNITGGDSEREISNTGCGHFAEEEA